MYCERCEKYTIKVISDGHFSYSYYIYSLTLSLSLSLSVCVCVCVCVWNARKRGS